MNEIWIRRLIEGTKTWNQVPIARKGEIRKILIEKQKNGDITMEEYVNITSEL